MLLKSRLLVPSLISPFVIFLLFLCIPAYHGIKLGDYDMVVGNGNNLMFFKSSLNESTNVPVTEWPKDMKAKIVSVVPDLHTNAIYFSVLTKNSSSISIFYTELNKTVSIYSSSKGSIGSLNLYRDYLYFANETSKSVMRLAVANWNDSENDLSKLTPELVFMDVNATFESLVIHPINGLIFYTMWKRSNESSILAFDPKTQNISIVVENVHQPKGLYIDVNQNTLYWIDNPPGIYFNLEKISLVDHSNRVLILKGQNQHPYAISVLCSKMYWTDLMNKVLWELKTGRKDNRLVKYFNNIAPYGVSLINSPNAEECKKIDSQETESTTAVPPKDCFGKKCVKKEDNASKDGDSSSNKVIPAGASIQTNNPRLCIYSEETFCFNDATCIKLDTQVHCLCKKGFSGQRCGERSNEIKCYSSWSSNPPLVISSLVFILVTFIMLIIIAVLVRKVKRQNKLPKIRRRVVVSHRSDIDSNIGSSSSVCEMIDIENCCNMNICETPCYERLGSFSTGTSSGRSRKTSVKEDKACLLSS